MARIVGNLVPEDDYMHPLGPESNFNESMYFNFFDPEQSVGGWLRLGNRANEGYAEMTVTLYLTNGRVLFMFKRPQIESNDAFNGGGLRFSVLEPGEQLRTIYEGSAVDLNEPREMSDPRRAFRENPARKVTLDLVHQAVGPMYGQRGGEEESGLSAEEKFAAAHYEQHMRVSGSLQIADQTLTIDGFGLRDHSWGPRYWQAIHRYEWLTLNFGEDFGAMVSIVQRDPEGQKIRKSGVVVRGEELDPIVEAEVSADYEENGLYHREVRARVRTESGEEMQFDGVVRGFIPLRNRREGRVTHIGEGMTEWRCGERVGYGLSEFLKQVE
jgi:hypothetical protein